MKESKDPHKLFYKNDTMSISFSFYLEGLMIDFANRTDENIKINWDQLRMTVNDTEKKIQHILISEEKLFLYQPPSIISAKSKCTDFVAFADNIYYINEEGNAILKVRDMYPETGDKTTRDSIQQLKGQRIALSLPIEINNVSRSWGFNFLLEEIKFIRTTNTGFSYSFRILKQDRLE